MDGFDYIRRKDSIDHVNKWASSEQMERRYTARLKLQVCYIYN